MSDFNQAIGPTLKEEGSDFVPQDHGRGASKFGITLLTYQEIYPHATAADIEALTPETATAFYLDHWWNRYHFGLINDQTLANKVFDLSVNDGPGTAIMWLQRSSGVDHDGILGLITAAAVNKLDSGLVLLRIRALAGEHYLELAKTSEENARELNGWLARLDKS